MKNFDSNFNSNFFLIRPANFLFNFENWTILNFFFILKAMLEKMEILVKWGPCKL